MPSIQRLFATLPAFLLAAGLAAGPANAMSHKDGEHTDGHDGKHAKQEKGKPAGAKAELKNGKGEAVGTVHFKQLANGVLVHAKITKLPPGTHAFHIHETGKCDAPDFASAGGHYAPHGNKHGLDVAGGPHAGDFPNIHVGADGSLEFEALNSMITLREGKGSVFKEGGTAVMIHQGADDYGSQPSGAAGPRLACGVIEKP